MLFLNNFIKLCFSVAGEGETETIKEEHDDNDDQEPVVSCFLSNNTCKIVHILFHMLSLRPYQGSSAI